MRLDYVAVPWPTDAPEPQAETRQELEEIGFVLLGGCALAPGTRGGIEKIAAMYGEHAQEFLTWAAVPGQVLVSADGTTFAHLAWLWTCRHATLTTVLDDGSLVQTTADWGAMPQPPTALAGAQRAFDRATEQRTLTSDPDTEIVPGPAAELWAVHRRRLEAVPSHRIPPHTSLDDFVAAYRVESRARSRWAARMPAAALALSFTALLVPYLVLVSVLGRQPWWVDSALVLAAAAGTLVLYRRLWPRTRRWRRLRPRVRVPVPGADASSPPRTS